MQKNELVTTIPGLQIVNSQGNEAGSGELSLQSSFRYSAVLDYTGLNEWTIQYTGGEIDPTPAAAPWSIDADIAGFQTALTEAGFTIETLEKNSAGDKLTLVFVGDELPGAVANEVISGSGDYDRAGVLTVEAADKLLSWSAPNDSEGGAVPASEGLVTLYSANGTASITVNITMDLLPADSVSNVAVAVSEIVRAREWSFRRSAPDDLSLDLLLAVAFDSGASYQVQLKDKTVSLELPIDDRPASMSAALVGGADGVTQSDTVFISYTDVVKGRLSYAKISTLLSGSASANYAITFNDPSVSRALRNEAIDRMRKGLYTGDVRDLIRIVTAHDAEANLALTMLEAGTDYEELLRAGFSTSTATQILASWFTVPSGAQATQTSALSQFAAIRNMDQAEIVDFINSAHGVGVTLPYEEIRDAVGKPIYSETDTTAIAGIISGG